jgi:hypothetical protein
MSPLNPKSIRFLITRLPIESSLLEAPMTATFWGLNKDSSMVFSPSFLFGRLSRFSPFSPFIPAYRSGAAGCNRFYQDSGCQVSEFQVFNWRRTPVEEISQFTS